MHPRVWVASRRSLLAILLLLLLTAQDKCVDYFGPGKTGTAPPPTYTAAHVGKSTAEKGGTPELSCTANPFTFVSRKEPVDCSLFDFVPLINVVMAQRDAVFGRLKCPTPRCPNRQVKDINLKARCDSPTRAAVVLDSQLICSTSTATSTGGLTLPPTGTSGTTATIGDPLFKGNETFEQSDVGPVACGELVKYEYREKIDDCRRGGFNFKPWVRRAYEAARRYHAALTCATGCRKLPDPVFIYHEWGCPDHEVEVDVYFISCVP